MDIPWDKIIFVVGAFVGVSALIYYSIEDHNRQVRKALHRRRMRGKLSVVEGGKQYGKRKD